MDTNILLESGTNELEVLEFRIGENYYGINVAKIREILPYQKITSVPNVHPYIEGLFMPRNLIITVVNLPRALGQEEHEDTKNDMLIITNFNNLNVAFHVHQVVGIHRISWADISVPDETINTKENSVATGILKFPEKLVIVLDFEKIVTDISPETGLKVSDIQYVEKRDRSECRVLIAEDSPLLSKLIQDSLTKAGFQNLTVCNNGQEAWDKMLAYRSQGGNIYDHVRLVLTDIEMPMMDGHRLAKLIREEEEFDNVPIVIFSSLINNEMRRKGETLGVNAQISKPEIGKLVGVLDDLIDDTYEVENS